MAGHSKWKQIKRQKGVSDARRGALFTKLTREIMVAARNGGGDPAGNFRLRLAIGKARENNMPIDNIDRAIKKATGEAGAKDLEELTYEGRGPGGVAMIIETMTDNRNRTVADLRAALVRGGGSLGESGSSAWMFDQKGIVTLEGAGLDADEILLAAADAGADDLRDGEEAIDVVTPPDQLEAVRSALEAAGYPVTGAELVMEPSQSVEVDHDTALKLLKLLDKLEDLDDVQKVYANAEFPESALAAWEG